MHLGRAVRASSSGPGQPCTQGGGGIGRGAGGTLHITGGCRNDLAARIGVTAASAPVDRCLREVVRARWQVSGRARRCALGVPVMSKSKGRDRHLALA